MSELDFKVADLMGKFSCMGPATQVEYLNEILSKKLEKCQTVYGNLNWEHGTYWGTEKDDEGRDEHEAKLVCVKALAKS